MTLKKLGSYAGSILAIAGVLTLGASFFVLASDYEHSQAQQALIDKYQSRDINEMMVADEMDVLQGHIEKVMDIDGAAEFQGLSERDIEYRVFLMQDIGISVEKIEELGGSTERVRVLLKLLDEGPDND